MRNALATATVITCIAMLNGCVTRRIEPLSPSLSAHLDEPLVCAESSDCVKLWRRAQVWVSANAGYKIQTATDAVVETYNPQNYSFGYAMRLTRNPVGKGDAERIDLHPNCGSAGLCQEAMDHLVARFRRDMRGAQ